MGAHDGSVSTRIVIRPLGSGLPLGFFSFGIGMLVLAGLGIGWIPVAETKGAGLLLLTFVAPLELLAAVIAFLARDTGGATGLGLFAGSWFASGWTFFTAAPGSTSSAFGLFLVAFGTAIFLLAVLSFPGKPLLALLLGVSTLRMGLGAAYELSARHGLLVAAGWVAFVLFLVAMYGGLAFGLEDVQQRTVLPLLRRGAARDAIEGSLDEQLRGLATEAGVRQQL
jgi:uncharacterized protein